LRCAAFIVQFEGNMLLKTEFSIKTAAPKFPDFFCEVIRNAITMERWGYPIAVYAAGNTILFGPKGVAETTKQIRVKRCLGDKVHMVVVIVTAFMRKAPAFNANTLFRSVAIDHAIQLIPVSL
jgi:hypothetical protein